MLRVTIAASELWDEENECFITIEEQTLCLEHSLVSLSKWESKWNKPFLSKEAKTKEETLDYIRCMTVGEEAAPEVYISLSAKNLKKIDEYINAPMTATTFSNLSGKGKKNGGIITAEIIYYWMIALQISKEYESWHLNKLITLIRVCELKNSPGKKMSKAETMRHQAQLNAARRQKLNSKG